MPINQMSPIDQWSAIINLGLNQSTYKMAFGKTLIHLASVGDTRVCWKSLSEKYLEIYRTHLKFANYAPQSSNPNRVSVIERIINDINLNKITEIEASNRIGLESFKYVIEVFHNIDGKLSNIFYDFIYLDHIMLKQPLFDIVGKNRDMMDKMIDIKWRQLEESYLNKKKNMKIIDDIRKSYAKHGTSKRAHSQKHIPVLQKIQYGKCFYCEKSLDGTKICADHVLPRQVVQHDEIWNIVLSHWLCNSIKYDRLVGPHYIDKLIERNEKLILDNHPWGCKIKSTLGIDQRGRSRAIMLNYECVKIVLGENYWGGIASYSPENDRILLSILRDRQ